MMYKSLILGVLFSIGIFAVKAGAGLCYSATRKKGPWKKIGMLLLFTVAYGAVFALVALFLHYMDPLGHLMAIQQFLKSGMVIHVVMAALMMIWGVFLLRPSGDLSGTSRGWLLLVLPCPVCGAVILFSTAFLVSFFPDRFMWVTSGLFLVFVIISLMSMGIIHLMEKIMMNSPETLLGATMLLSAGYFLLSVTVMPQFADLDKVYRMASYQSGKTSIDIIAVILMAGLTTLLFSSGFLFKFKSIRRS